MQHDIDYLDAQDAKDLKRIRGRAHKQEDEEVWLVSDEQATT